MENTEKEKSQISNGKAGRIFGGAVLIIIGAGLLARQSGVDFPHWLFSWKTLLIALGGFIGFRHSFRGFGWLIPIIIGSVFLIEEFVPTLEFHNYVWPVLIIVFGLFMIFRPRHKPEGGWNSKSSSEEYIDATSIFGGTKRNVISKDFKGADITNICGGTEFNLMQADIQGTVVVDVTQVFGGTKLLVPAHWIVKSDVVCIFGGIDDKRSQTTQSVDPSKVLVLDGTCVFGGIEIKSY